ncbi:GvpL/GvpF family gas vesicle protein [Streptomyces sp. NPDC000405]|uniref:GvpL/GvpF family gas vesicle protein n=1 Tax=Streptomyces sp. NPDC000405 TaxID=3161033 RepID=UPI00398C9DE0
MNNPSGPSDATDRAEAANDCPHDTSAGLLYLYAVARHADLVGQYLTRPPHAQPVTGVAGEPVRLVRHLDLVGVAGRVPAADFDEEPLHRHLEDLDWLAAVAHRHQAVVEAASSAAAAGVLPLRLATVYRDAASLRRMFQARHEALTTALDHLDGKVEWGVKIYTLPSPETEARTAPDSATVPDSAAAPASATAPAGAAARDSATAPATGGDGGPKAPAAESDQARSAAAPGIGRAYLRRRGAERRADEDRARQADDAVRQIHTALAASAEAAHLHPPQNSSLSVHPGRNLLNASYLVRRDDDSAFTAKVRAQVERAPASGLMVELTGPWVPYSFVAATTGLADGTTDDR